MTTTPTLEARPGGRAVGFIYAGVFLGMVPLGSMLEVPVYGLAMTSGLVAVLAGTVLPPYVFRAPRLRATDDGLWTRRLGLVPWAGLKDVLLERKARFSTEPTLNNVTVHLVVETTDGRRQALDALYLDVDAVVLVDQIRALWRRHAAAPEEAP